MLRRLRNNIILTLIRLRTRSSKTIQAHEPLYRMAQWETERHTSHNNWCNDWYQCMHEVTSEKPTKITFCEAMSRPKVFPFQLKLMQNECHFGTKCVIKNKLLNQNYWSWYHIFSGEDTPSTDTSYCIHILWEVCRSVVTGPPCIPHDWLRYDG